VKACAAYLVSGNISYDSKTLARILQDSIPAWCCARPSKLSLLSHDDDVLFTVYNRTYNT